MEGELDHIGDTFVLVDHRYEVSKMLPEESSLGSRS